MISEVLDYSWLALLFVNCGEAGHYGKGYGKENCSFRAARKETGRQGVRGEEERKREVRRGREEEERRVDDFMDSPKSTLYTSSSSLLIQSS